MQRRIYVCVCEARRRGDLKEQRIQARRSDYLFASYRSILVDSCLFPSIWYMSGQPTQGNSCTLGKYKHGETILVYRREGHRQKESAPTRYIGEKTKTITIGHHTREQQKNEKMKGANAGGESKRLKNKKWRINPGKTGGGERKKQGKNRTSQERTQRWLRRERVYVAKIEMDENY